MHLDGETLTVDQLAEAAYHNTRVEVFPEQAARVKASRDLLDGFVESGRIIYGVTTAVGGFVNWLIPEELAEKLQKNILRGVSSNVGPDLEESLFDTAQVSRPIIEQSDHGGMILGGVEAGFRGGRDG